LEVDLCTQTQFIEAEQTPVIEMFTVNLFQLEDTMSIRYNIPDLCQKTLVVFDENGQKPF
jgi:hypothetical protein